MFDALPKPIHSKHPLSMEDIGAVVRLYSSTRTRINGPVAGTLAIKDLRDYGIVFLNGIKMASLDRRK